jgi:hypothetical protein
MPEDYSSDIDFKALALVAALVLSSLGLILGGIAFFRSGNAVDKAESSSRMAMAASDQYSLLSSSWSALSQRIDVAENHAMSLQIPNSADTTDWGRAIREMESDRGDLWRSIKKIVRRVRHLERLTKDMRPAEEKKVEAEPVFIPAPDPNEQQQEQPVEQVVPQTQEEAPLQ